MEKNIIIVLFFFIFIYIFIIFDLVRYFTIHFDADDKYIKNYKFKPKVGHEKIIVSLTSTPMRIKKIKPVIKSLLDQTVRVDQIVINIPKSFNCDIPKELNDMCNIYKCGKDYGPGTKLIPTVLRETSENVILILVEDDYIYGKTFIEDLLNKYKENPSCLFSKEGVLLKPDFLHSDLIYTTKKFINNDWIKNYVNTNINEIKNKNNIKSFLI